jgi:hypothetical protein
VQAGGIVIAGFLMTPLRSLGIAQLGIAADWRAINKSPRAVE